MGRETPYAKGENHENMQEKYRQGDETCGLRVGYQDLRAISHFLYKKLLA